MRGFTNRGFSLTELMVAITVMTIITSAVVVQFSGFDAAIVAKARAYDIAKTVRLTQSYATRVRDVSSDITFDLSYGIQFTRGSGEMQIFSRRGADYPSLDQGATLIETKTLPAGYAISALCVEVAGETELRCAPTDGQTLSTSFRRPEITSYPNASWYIGDPTSIVRALIALRGSGSDAVTHWIEVGKTGSITLSTE